MEGNFNKPKLVFFQWNHESLPHFLKLHMQLHVKCLAHFFDVVLVNKDCDYQDICDTYQPDITLFESGYRTSLSKKLNIQNTSAYSSIPKVGLHNGDPWCECRTGFISDMEHWGIDTFFTIGTTAAEHTPELAENLFVWPNFIDSEIYKDYSQNKVVPVLFNGYINPLYPWRQKIFKIVSNCYPSLIYPHLGYENHSPVMIHGEEYARTINASWFVPACGTLAKEVVRKHFEIPGSKSCLIAEKSPSLEAAGFVDMQNCIFADENDVLDKIEFLFKNKVELERLTNAGYQLVQSRHTLKQRDQIFQWYKLHSIIKPHEKIIQTDPFGQIKIVASSSAATNKHIICNGLNLELLHQADEKLFSGNYDAAEELYLKCLSFIHWMCEPKLKLAICNLYKGNAEIAHQWVIEPIQNNLSDYKALDPDPVEWAYFLISLLCQGRLNEAIIRANQFTWLHHSELERTRWVINFLQYGVGDISNLNILSLHKPRPSVHQLPQTSFPIWIENLCTMLESCQQKVYADALMHLINKDQPSSALLQSRTLKDSRTIQGIGFIRNQMLLARINWLKGIEKLFELSKVPNPRPGLPPLSEIDYVIRLSRWAKLDSGRRYILKQLLLLKKHLHSVAFIKPSEKKDNDFFKDVHQILLNDEIQTVVVIGASLNIIEAEPLFNNKHTLKKRIRVFYINTSYNQPLPFINKNVDLFSYHAIGRCPASFSSELTECLKKIKDENKINFFDLIIISGSLTKVVDVELEQLQGARYIILNGINAHATYKNKQVLSSALNYSLLTQNPLFGNGYAIFQNTNFSLIPAADIKRDLKFTS